MTQRREFLKKSVLLGSAFALQNLLPNEVNAQSIKNAEDTEDYWKLVRSHFPLKKDKIFLNNGTIGPSPFSVINEVHQEMMNVESHGKYGGYEDELMRETALFLNCLSTEISITRNVTEGINIVVWGLNLKAGDEVIISSHEHVGHATPWLNRAKLHGIKLVVVNLGKTAEETLDIVKNAITKKTKVISLPHIPCTIGQLLPVNEICRIARERGIYSLIDGAHPPGMLDIHLKQIDCDFYVGCFHKWILGPKGTGFLYVSENKRNEVQTYYAGGAVDTGWDMLANPPFIKGYVENGHRYFYGTQNAALFKGVIKAFEFHNDIGKHLIEKRVKSLGKYLQEQLLSLGKSIEMQTPTEEVSRAAQISFKIKNKDMTELQKQCNEQNITTRFVAENNINCLRISTHIYNNFQEIDKFITEVDKFIKA